MKRVPTKVTFIGESAVGKSSIVLRIGRNKFDDAIGTTIGGAFCTVKYSVAGQPDPIIFNFWDCAGQTRYNALVPMYLRGSAVIIIAFDITNRETFERIGTHWLPFVRQTLVIPEDGREPMMFLIGNKVDLAKQRQVSSEEAQTFADNQGMSFCEVSARTGDNIQEIMRILSGHVADVESDAPFNSDTVQVGESPAAVYSRGFHLCSGCGFT